MWEEVEREEGSGSTLNTLSEITKEEKYQKYNDSNMIEAEFLKKKKKLCADLFPCSQFPFLCSMELFLC